MKYRLLIVGCGVISHEWFNAMKGRDDIEVAGMVDIRMEAAKAQQERYGISCPIYTDFDIALEEIKPDVVVDLANAPAHFSITKKSLEAGCHVFGEKPMCMTREEGAELLETVKKSGYAFNVMQNRRYLPGVRALRHAVQNGTLGKIWMTCCEIYVNADLAGGRNTLPYPMLQDQAIHSFDSARFILGADAKTVYCHSYNPEGSHYNGDGSGACIFEMSDGSVLVYNAVMDTNVMKTAWHSQWRIIGTKGTAVWNGFDERPQAELIKEDGTIEKVLLELPPEWNGISWFSGGVDEMLAALKEGRKAETDCSTNYGSVAMTFSAIESVKTGQKVEVK